MLLYFLLFLFGFVDNFWANSPRYLSIKRKGLFTVCSTTSFCFLLLDYEPPVLTCPGPKLNVNNDKGKNVSTVNWNFTFSDNSLTENEPGITKDSFTVVLTINDKNVDLSLPKLIGIGTNTVKYVVTDPAGKSSSCSFTVEVAGKKRCFFVSERNYDRKDFAACFFNISLL